MNATKSPPLHATAAQTKLRIDDNAYLQQHPEVQQMIAALTNKLLAEKPDEPLQVALQFLSDPEGVRAAIAATSSTS